MQRVEFPPFTVKNMINCFITKKSEDNEGNKDYKNLKFSVGHGKFNFPSLNAEIGSSGRIPIVSFAIDTIIVVDLKKYHVSIILLIRNFVYFSTVRPKNGFKKEVRGLVGPPLLSPECTLFLRLRWGGWNFLVALLGLVLPQISAKKNTKQKKQQQQQKKPHVVTSVPSLS